MPTDKNLCCSHCGWETISFLTEEDLKELNPKCPKCGCPILELKDKIKSV